MCVLHVHNGECSDMSFAVITTYLYSLHYTLGSFTYYVISWGGGGGGGVFPNDYASVILTQWLCVKLIRGGGGVKMFQNLIT